VFVTHRFDVGDDDRGVGCRRRRVDVHEVAVPYIAVPAVLQDVAVKRGEEIL